MPPFRGSEEVDVKPFASHGPKPYDPPPGRRTGSQAPPSRPNTEMAAVLGRLRATEDHDVSTDSAISSIWEAVDSMQDRIKGGGISAGGGEERIGKLERWVGTSDNRVTSCLDAEARSEFSLGVQLKQALEAVNDLTTRVISLEKSNSELQRSNTQLRTQLRLPPLPPLPPAPAPAPATPASLPSRPPSMTPANSNPSPNALPPRPVASTSAATFPSPGQTPPQPHASTSAPPHPPAPVNNVPNRVVQGGHGQQNNQQNNNGQNGGGQNGGGQNRRPNRGGKSARDRARERGRVRQQEQQAAINAQHQQQQLQLQLQQQQQQNGYGGYGGGYGGYAGDVYDQGYVDPFGNFYDSDNY